MTTPNTALILHNHRKPDTDDWFVRPVVEAWYTAYVDAGNDHRDFAIQGTRWRASWAGSCARQIAYNVAGVEATNPVTVADAWRFNIGSMLHDHIQKVVLDRWPNSQVEVKVAIGDDGSGHADCLVVTDEGERIAVEIKSINGTGFKTSTIGKAKGSQPDGARVSAILQGALCAKAMDADRLIVAYFSLENVSTFVARDISEYRRFSAQWTFSRDEFMALADDEQRRMERIVSIVDRLGPDAVPRIIPDPNLPPHRVVNPAKGLLHIIDPETGDYLRSDRTWMCDYCSHREQCCESDN